MAVRARCVNWTMNHSYCSAERQSDRRPMVQNIESREAVFEMPAEAGQIPAIFASTVVAGDQGDSSDCEILSDNPKPETTAACLMFDL